MKFTITENTAERIEIALQGELDTLAAQQFAQDMEPVIKACSEPVESKASKQITMDFTELEYISSAGMRTILLLNKNAAAKGGKLSIKGMSEDIKQIFQMTGFDTMIEIL